MALDLQKRIKVPLDGGHDPLFTATGLLLARRHLRVVEDGIRGPCFEMQEILPGTTTFAVPLEFETDVALDEQVPHVLLRTIDRACVKVYWQLQTVHPWIMTYYYISVFDTYQLNGDSFVSSNRTPLTRIEP